MTSRRILKCVFLCCKRFILTSFLLGLSNLQLWAQLFENFEDGDFTSNPEWLSSNQSGEGGDFIISSGELQSAGPSASSTLWMATSALENTGGKSVTWEFYIRYDFAPSASNNIRIFLTSNNANLSEAEGYYLQLGKSGSNDGIDLFKSTSSTAVITDPNPTITANIDVSIKVEFDGVDTWTLSSKPTGNTEYFTIGTGSDNELGLDPYFGFRVKHSSTRKDAFYFDNISIALQDNLPPSLIDISGASPNELQLTFSEKLQLREALNTINYEVENVGEPISVQQGEKPEVLILTFNQTFESGANYNLSIKNIPDLAGNVLLTETKTFFFFLKISGQFKDVVFNELMIDFDPANDLPRSEFIEIFNRSEKVFELAGWSFSDVATSSVLPNKFLLPNEHLILCPAASIDQFEKFGETIGLSPWPTLNNSMDNLILKDELGVVIDSLNYDDNWYGSSFKSEGGWTLELIDSENICGEEDNWSVSESLAGGTPGATNSIKSQNPDLRGPELVEVLALAPDSLVIFFNEKLDESSVTFSLIQINQGINISSQKLSPSLRQLNLKTIEEFSPDIEYQVTVKNISDCSGNLINAQKSTSTFRLIEPLEKGDLLISEVLFNPRIEGVEFVEFYNHTSKVIDISEGYLASVDLKGNDSLKLQNFQRISEEIRLVKPSEFVVFTIDKDILKSEYPQGKEETFMQVKSLPSLPNQKGSIALVLADSTIIDRMNYDEDLHFELITDVKGVSLERIALGESALNTDNWKSATETAGFATPGKVNSQSITQVSIQGDITVDPPIIIPDGSGQNDFTTISYSFNGPGKVATVKILDMQGRVVATIAENDLLDATGFYTWDGLNKDNFKVRTGYYLIWFSVFDNSGYSNNYKKKIVVGSYFD